MHATLETPTRNAHATSEEEAFPPDQAPSEVLDRQWIPATAAATDAPFDAGVADAFGSGWPMLA